MKTQATIFHEPKRNLEEIQAFTTEELKNEVMKLLNWNDEEFQAFVFETGMTYLEQYFLDDVDAVNKLKVKKEFWNWFKNHWIYRDQAFFESFFLDDDFPVYFKREMYQALHKPEILICEIYPSSVILGNDFSTLKLQA